MSPVPACATTAAPGVYKPRRAQASPLFRLVSDHCRAFHAAYEDRFAATYGDWRPVVREVADKFLECGVLEHGFARVRCDACTQSSPIAPDAWRSAGPGAAGLRGRLAHRTTGRGMRGDPAPATTPRRACPVPETPRR